MELIISNIPDIISQNLDHTKVSLANQIIKKVHPMFDELRAAKLKTVENLNAKILSIKNEIKSKKLETQEFLTKYQREKLVKDYLDKIHMIIQTGNVTQESLKKELVIMTKITDKIPTDKYPGHIAKLDTMLSKMLNLR